MEKLSYGFDFKKNLSPSTQRSQRKSQFFVFEPETLNFLALLASLREKTILDV
jgi:hypothetical protein